VLLKGKTCIVHSNSALRNLFQGTSKQKNPGLVAAAAALDLKKYLEIDSKIQIRLFGPHFSYKTTIWCSCLAWQLLQLT
jgi:hypothetical protein